LINRLILAALALVIVPLSAVSAQNWNNEYVETDRGYRVGKPDAPIQLIAFVSYSCPVCEQFEIESDAGLRAFYIHSGKLALEIRPEIHSPMDMAATLLMRCGGPDKAFANHRAIFHAQEEWLRKADATSRTQQSRWFYGSQLQRMRAVAADLDFYRLMENRGFSYSQIDNCLGDIDAAVDILIDEAANGRDFAVPGTPSFAINGQLLANVHSWAALQPALAAALESPRE